MFYLPLADISVNLTAVFTIGLLAGILGGVFGPQAYMLIVPALGVLGLPLSVSAGANVGQSLGRSSFSLFTINPDPLTLRRLGLVTGISGLPGVLMGVKINLWLTGNAFGETIIYILYMALLLAAAAAVFLQWRHFNRNHYFDDSPIPPFGLNWKYALAIPGETGLKHVTLVRVLLVGLLLGFGTGLLGLGAGVTGVSLFMYILGLPAKNAAATDRLAMLVTGSGALFGYALAGRIELLLVLILTAAITLGNRIGSLLPGELNFSHARLAFSMLLAVAAVSLYTLAITCHQQLTGNLFALVK